MADRVNRDILVAGVAVVLVGVLLGVAWLTFGNRTEPPPPDPATAAQRFADAWVAGDRDAIIDVLVRRPGDDLDEGLAAFDALGATGFRVTVGEVTMGTVDGTARVTLLPELDLPEVDGTPATTWAWESTLDLERSRATWRVRWDHTSFHRQLDDNVHFELRRSIAPRAPILAFDGTPLTSTGEVVTVGIEPRRVPDEVRLADQLRTLLPEALEEFEDTFNRRDLNPGWFYPLVTVPESRLDGIRDRVAALPGVILRSDEGRVAEGSAARHLFGRVTPSTEDEAAAAGIEAGTPIGRGGLEELFDDRLQGGPILEVLAVESDGDVRGTVWTHAERPQEPVRTTLDAQVQQAVEDALVGRNDNTAVVFVGRDGGLLASSSRPLGGYNRAFAGAYPPGAAIWPLTIHAAIAAGNLDADDQVACPGEVRVGGVRFDNLGGFDLGEVPIDVALSEGCRTTVATLAGALAPDELRYLAEDLGFGSAPDVLLEAATSQWPAERDLAERAAAGVGQAKVLSSLVHLAGIAAAFTDGTWEPVHLVPAGEGEAGGVAAAVDAVPLDQQAWREARSLFAAAGARNDFTSGTGVVSGESNSPEGRLAIAVVIRDDLAGIVLVEQGTRQQALELARRTLLELDVRRQQGDR